MNEQLEENEALRTTGFCLTIDFTFIETSCLLKTHQEIVFSCQDTADVQWYAVLTIMSQCAEEDRIALLKGDQTCKWTLMFVSSDVVARFSNDLPSSTYLKFDPQMHENVYHYAYFSLSLCLSQVPSSAHEILYVKEEEYL